MRAVQLFQVLSAVEVPIAELAHLLELTMMSHFIKINTTFDRFFLLDGGL